MEKYDKNTNLVVFTKKTTFTPPKKEHPTLKLVYQKPSVILPYMSYNDTGTLKNAKGIARGN